MLTNPANYTPNLVDTGDRKPVAYAAAEAGTQMVVGGDFNAVENSTRTTQYNRSNVFAFNANHGTSSTRTSTRRWTVTSGPCW